MSAILPRMVWP